MPNSSEMYHYGVLGMKWGVRKDPKRAHARASQKLRKLDETSTKKRERASVWQEREDKARWKQGGFTILGKGRQYRKERKAHWKVAKYNYKAEKLNQKARKWYRKMEEVFKDYDISSFNPDDIALGQEYAKYVFYNAKERRQS